MECISCKGREGSFSFKTIEVRTILNPGRNSLFKAASRDLGQDSLDDREPNTELTEND